MSTAYPRPVPAAADDARFWEFIAAGGFRVQRSTGCPPFRHPPRSVCACGERASEWIVSPGHGEVWSFTVIHPPTLPAFSARTPYGAVVVRLDEGVFLVSNLVDCPVEDLAVGMRVELAITTVDGDFALPLFRRAR